ncbi:MAG: hypothetical protein Q9227_003118 [Pyrenula ochraceoflavens]
MAAKANGKPKESIKANGHLSSPKVSRRPKQAPSAGAAKRAFSISIRLLVWYVIGTTIFRCPPTLSHITDTSPTICKPYLVTKSYVQPYIEPYYEEYAAPYVEIARPYAEKVNYRVVTPSVRFAKSTYHAYGAPRFEQAKEYGQLQWEKSVMPQLVLAQARAQDLYKNSAGPYVENAKASFAPYYGIAKDNALYLHQKHIQPAYTVSRPYIEKAYSTGYHFMAETGLPLTKQAWASTVVFLDGTFWPFMRGLYKQNVEPQIVMIGERLVRYRESRKLKAAMDEVDLSASQRPSYMSDSIPTASPTTLNAEQTSSPTVETASTDSTETVSLTSEQQIAAARDKIATDLRTWQEKFAIAADKGSDDLSERVNDIMEGLISSEVDGEANGLWSALNKSAEVEIMNVKRLIKEAVTSLPEDSGKQELEHAESQIFGGIRTAGMSVRDRAQALRKWYNVFDTTLLQRAEAASTTTLSVLDNISDLGLQEIGMRWAWMDGVTYQDWAKYHELKHTFSNWRTEVQDVAMKHEKLEKARNAGTEIVSKAMDVAEAAAKELVRLKDVGKWKIRARDSSDNFENRVVPAAVASASSSIAQKAAELSGGQEKPLQNLAESILYDGSSSVADFTSAASSAALEDTTTDVGEQAPSLPTVGTSISDSVDEAVGSANMKSNEIEDATRSALSGDEADVTSADDGTPNILSSASETVSTSNEDSSSISSAGKGASKSVWGGAMAQSVKGTKPILDDTIDDNDDVAYSEKLQKVISEAGDRYADATRAVSEALFGTTPTPGESAASIASDQYSRALSAASNVLYGTDKQGSMESATSVASEKYSEAVFAASTAIFGTPTPATESLLSQASSLYSDAVRRAEEHYLHAKSIASQQISGTPKPVHEQMLASIESAYSGSLEAASERLENAKSAAKLPYSSLTDAASSAFATSTQGFLESVSSVASARLQDGLSSASAQYSDVKASYGPAPTPAHQSILQDAQRKYYEAIGLAHERYSEYLGVASGAIYGSPTPAYESAYSAASEAVYGTPTAAYQSLVANARTQYDSASSRASANLAAALDTASSVVGATTKSPMQEMIEQASSQYEMAISAASESLSAASSAASSAAYGAPQGTVESLSSQASANWQTLMSKASEQIYGGPTPWSDSIVSQAGEYPSQVTDAAISQYSAMSALMSELVYGKEPDFTESVMNRFTSAYNGGYHVSIASSAASYASGAYATASSAMSTYFTPPPTVESILDSAAGRLNAAVEAASNQIYGTPKGTLEQATSAAAESLSSASSMVAENVENARSKASGAVYGTQTGYAEAASSSISEAMASAMEAINAAFSGTSTGTADSVTSAASNAYASASSIISENVDAAGSVVSDAYTAIQAKVSEAIYGPEKGALESAQLRLSGAVESARIKLAAFAGDVGNDAAGAYEAAKSNIEEFASSVSSTASSITDRAKDEL